MRATMPLLYEYSMRTSVPGSVGVADGVPVEAGAQPVIAETSRSSASAPESLRTGFISCSSLSGIFLSYIIYADGGSVHLDGGFLHNQQEKNLRARYNKP